MSLHDSGAWKGSDEGKENILKQRVSELVDEQEREQLKAHLESAIATGSETKASNARAQLSDLESTDSTRKRSLSPYTEKKTENA